MPRIDCICGGRNPNCDKCSGSGYYDTEKITNQKKIFIPKEKKHNSTKDIKKPFSKSVKELTPENLIKEIQEITIIIDSLSKQQENIKKATSYRKRKFEEIKRLEKEKSYLKRRLNILLKQADYLGISIRIKYKHPLSNKRTRKGFKFLKKKSRKTKKKRKQKKVNSNSDSQTPKIIKGNRLINMLPKNIINELKKHFKKE